MLAVLHSIGMFVIDFFKSPRRLEAENLFLRHHLRAPRRFRLRGSEHRSSSSKHNDQAA